MPDRLTYVAGKRTDRQDKKTVRGNTLFKSKPGARGNLYFAADHLPSQARTRSHHHLSYLLVVLHSSRTSYSNARHAPQILTFLGS